MPTNKEEKEAGWLSVTEVLDTFIPKGLLDWYLKTGKKEAKRLSTIAMKIGSRVDELIQEDITKGSFKLAAKDSIEVKNCMEAWKSYRNDYQPKDLSCQLEVLDPIEKVIGHVDLLTDNTLIDVKCASSIKPNYWLQVSAYYSMLPNELFNRISQVAILRLDKNLGAYQFMTIRQAGLTPNNCIETFGGLLKAYRYYNPIKSVDKDNQIV